MVYTIGPISRCHINPAVSNVLWAGNRFPAWYDPPFTLWFLRHNGVLIPVEH